MKKSVLVLLCSLTLFLVTGCKDKEKPAAADNSSTETTSTEKKETKKTAKKVAGEAVPFMESAYDETKPEYHKRNQPKLELNSNNQVSYDSVDTFFTLDYTPEYPDNLFNEVKEKANTKIKADANDKSESIIPGIRKLTDYITKYSTKKAKLADYNPQETNIEDEKDDKNVEFTITDFGPTGKIVAGEEHPVFYVIFSKPVRSLKALDEPAKTSDIMTIDPPLPGVFRWYGTKHLSFQSDEPADPTVQYTVTINPELKSLSGKKISGQTSFKTTAEDIKIINLWGGYIKESDCAYSEMTGALPPYEHRFIMRTNYVTSVESIRKNLTVYVNNTAFNYKVSPVYQDIFYYWSNNPKFDEEKKKTNTFLVEIEGNVNHNSTVLAAITADGNSSSVSSYQYVTLQPFVITDVDGSTGYSSGKTSWPLTICMSQVPDINTLCDNISFNFDYKLTKDNFRIDNGYYKRLTICNLPLDFDKDYTITFKNGIKDIYGQPLMLNNNAVQYNFRTPPVKSYVKFQNYGTTMLEAQFPHKMLFEYQNIINGNYTLQKTKRPVGDGTYYLNTDPAILTEIDKGEENKRHFQELDLDPYLDNGYGFVRFDADVSYWWYNYWKEKNEVDHSSMSGVVQVTDLGITARMAFNKAVVMVRSLSTGKPVPNARVLIVHDLNDYHRYNSSSRSYIDKDVFVPGENEIKGRFLYAEGKTDENGFAVINYSEMESNNIMNDGNAYVYVINGDDKAAFYPSSHNSWREGVSTSSASNARKPEMRTFMFVDRGLYKPGETVTFRGIDRDQLLGNFIPHRGSYTITSAGSWWRAKEIIEPIQGELSESGGFYGSFKLPDDLEPGYYNLTYKRNQNQTESIMFTVANFERVKFESSITVPEITYYGGDKVSATLSADYLAGGSLNGAPYSVNWSRGSTTFRTSAPEAKGFSFDTGVYSDITYYNDDTGSLGVDGTASISCNTEKIENGAPYLYHVETTVTDVSNQRIAAQNDIMVHPAQFYIGLKKARNTSGFAKKDQKLELPYILVGTDGKILKDSDVPLKVSELEYSLTHEVWTMVHEQSVDNTIYTRYERSDVEDFAGDLKAVNSGILPLTPTEAGWYTLTVTGKDSKGNKVLSKLEFYVTGGRTTWYDRYDSQSLSLTPDQSQYNPGENARILLESPLPAGDYLITVEREGIFTEEIKHFENGAEVIEVPIAGNYVPVVYVSVSSYSERHGTPDYNYGEPDLDKPKGYYGVTPLFINPYVRSFSVKIECDKPTYRPGETATIKFTATKGGLPYEGAELTAMAVDRGVLDLINYHVPNPIDFFYNKYNFPLRVKGGDSRALLMDPVTYSIKNLQGGDAEDDEKEDERKDFRPTAFFEPVLITDANGEATVTFKMPDSLTSYRITAFGVKDDLFALQEDEVKVQNPINIQQVQPRRLRERDTAECGILISNLGKDGQNVTVTLEVISPTDDTEEDKLAGRKTIPGKGFVDGPAKHTVYVASGQSTVVYFDVSAQTEGTVNLVYTIKSDVLNEKLISPIKIEKTFVYETVTMTGSTSTDKNAKEKESLMIPGFAKEGRGDLKFTLDATRLGLLGSSVNYLFEYPYGCMEQQSSRILPLVAFSDYIDVFGLDSKVGNIKDCVTSFTKSWDDYQHSDGGFGYWPDSIYSNSYVSMRVAHVYALAMNRGYSEKDIPININSLKRYISSELNDIRNSQAAYNSKNIRNKDSYVDNYFEEAYACYIFSLLGDYTSLNFYKKDMLTNLDKLELDEMAYLSVAYSNAGDMETAAKINTTIRSYLQPAQRSVTISSKAKNGYWFWNRSETMQYATILSALVSVNPEDEMVDRLIHTLLTKQSHGRWQNTLTTSTVLESIYTYIQKRNLDDTNYSATAKLNGKEIMNEYFKGVAAKPKTLVLPFEDEFVNSLPRDKGIPVEFEKKGDGHLFYTVEMKYALPDEMQAARNEGLKVEYTITDFDTGAVINPAKETTDITLESGKLYKATIQLSTNLNRDYVALRAPIPSGAEILDSTFVTTGSVTDKVSSSSWRSWLSHKAIQDNEIQFFWDEMYSGSVTVDFTFRTARRGVYPTPPVQAECMYEPEVFGRSDGYLFLIK